MSFFEFALEVLIGWFSIAVIGVLALLWVMGGMWGVLEATLDIYKEIIGKRKQ